MPESRRESLATSQLSPDILLTAEALRNASNPPPASDSKDDKGIPLIWRVFGGTVLSIAAMLGVTLYQQLHNKVENLADALVKKQEFFDHRKGVWDRFQALQKQSDVTETELKQRCARLEEQVKINEQLRQEIIPELKHVRDMTEGHLKEASTRLEHQVRMSDDERKTLMDEVRRLQDRLAKMETSAKSSRVSSAVYRKKD